MIDGQTAHCAAWPAAHDFEIAFSHASQTARPPMPLNPADWSLRVFDVDASCRYFERSLGLITHSRTGVPPHRAELRRDALNLTLIGVRGPGHRDDDLEQHHLRAILIEADTEDALRALFEHAGAHGARMRQPLQTRPWGVLTFVMKDLDGNLLLCSAPLDEVG